MRNLWNTAMFRLTNRNLAWSIQASTLNKSKCFYQQNYMLYFLPLSASFDE